MSSLAPPLTPSTTNKTMSSPPSTSSDSVSDSGPSSPNSSRSDSPLVVFDSSLDPTDSLSNFFIDSSPTDVHSGSGGDSSAEDSLFSSTPPPSHESPAGDWPATDTTTSKDSADPLWSQPDFSSFSLDGLNSISNMDFPLGFDPMLFSSDPLFSMDSTGTGASSTDPADFSSYAFNFGTENFPNLHVPFTDSSGRRLSVTSSSSSGLSLSPVSEHTQAVLDSASGSSHGVAPAPPSPPADQTQLSNEQLMDELAARARQIVGLTMALPLGMNTTSHSDKQPNQPPSVASSSSSMSETSVPQTFTQPDSSPSPTPTTTNSRTKTSHTTIERRYRTNLNARIQSLRAAVPALRVLEVKAGNRVGNLSLKAGTRRVGVDADAEAGEEDVIDERGYIDGVKVARKGSKANVLGKAVEYIRVLKRREMRLKREQEGLKALMRSLVGGPELVQQWETMWRERFGGPEKDEVDGEDGEADDENDDGEDEDDANDREDKEDESGATFGKKRKRAKVDSLSSVKGKGKKANAAAVGPEASNYSQATQPIPIIPAQAYSNPMSILSMPVPAQPEKRKRGRPRKVPLPPVAVPNSLVQNTFAAPFATHPFQQQSVATVQAPNEMRMEVDPVAIAQSQPQPPPQAQPQSGQQYLLAVFTFFSFFNPPFPYSASSSWDNSRHTTHSHTRTGSVLGDPRPEAIRTGWPTAVLPFGWRDAVQFIHLIVSVFLLLSIVSPWLPHLARYIPHALKPIMGVPVVPIHSDTVAATEVAAVDGYTSDGEKSDTAARNVLLSALRKGRTLVPAMEAQLLREALGLGTGVLGLLQSLTRQVGSPGKRRSRYGLERQMLEQKVFLRFAELVALDAKASMTTRVQTYFYALKFFSIFSASVSDISTLALVIQPLWRAKSASLWALALSRAQGKGSSSPHVCRTYETYILESMTVDEAALKVSRLDRSSVACVAGSVEPVYSDIGQDDDEGGYGEPVGPLAVLARQAIRDFIRTHAECVFLQTVPSDEGCHGFAAGDENCDPNAAEYEMRRVVVAGRSLDTRTATLADVFERVCNPTSASFASDVALDSEEFEGASGVSADADAELRALLRAVVLYRRIFPSTLLNVAPSADAGAGYCATGSGISISLTPMPSPPPSPSRRNAALHLALRRCLDSVAFDRGDELEDARDRVVDMLTAESSGWPKRLQC